MSRRIHVLPDTLANQIAAGEVVERPASVVKELIENALDARATRIDVAVRNGGKTEIRVADDGHGMGREDALLALDRHATSKIAKPEDLRAIATLGFRGEALPSIASVSRLVLETAEEGSVGTRMTVNGGRLGGVEDCARQRGTSVSARSLFFNTPARAKFTRTAAVETRAVAEVVTSLALANLSAAFRLESNGRALLDLPAAADLVSRVAALWGDDFARQLAPLAASVKGMRVAGLVQRPDRAETGPRRVHLFVGGRPFRDRGIQFAAERGYRTTVPQGARPSLLLYLEVEPGGVDVNVHPAKAEVRFADRLAVEALVEEAVREALGALDSAATIDAHPALPQLRRTDAGGGAGPSGAGAHGAGGRGAGIPSVSGATDPEADQFALFMSARPAATAAEAQSASDEAEEHRPALWQVHNSYIIAETRSGLLIIDQHSAHERVMFERLMRAFQADGLPGQRLLFPITLRLSAQEYAVFDDNRGLFESAGFDIEPFGDRTVIVNTVPAPHPYFDAERCLREMVAELAAGSELTRAAHNQHERIAMTFACKSAIKAGQKLTDAEMLELFDRLFETELPSHDVHGRPTIIRLSLSELERRFGRHG